MAAPAHIARANGRKGGRPPGKRNKATLRREAVLKAMQQRIMNAADLLLDSQMTAALGQTYLFKIEKYWETVPDKNGTPRKILRHKPPERVTDEYEMRAYIEREIVESELGHAENQNDPEATYYFLTAKDPDTKASEAMFNRTFGRSVQPVVLTDDDGKSIFDHDSKTKADKALGAFLGHPTGQGAPRAPRARRKQRN